VPDEISVSISSASCSYFLATGAPGMPFRALSPSVLLAQHCLQETLSGSTDTVVFAGSESYVGGARQAQYLTAMRPSLPLLRRCLQAAVVPARGGRRIRRQPSDTMAQRMQACVACHGQEGARRTRASFPASRASRQGYLYNQLVNFRDGKRQNATMAYLVDPMSDAYLREIAAYFSSLDLPYPPPQTTHAPAPTLARGEQLVRHGDAARGIPACASCHGSRDDGSRARRPGTARFAARLCAGAVRRRGATARDRRPRPTAWARSRGAFPPRTSLPWRPGCHRSPSPRAQQVAVGDAGKQPMECGSGLQ
jgi:cytochrome c553